MSKLLYIKASPMKERSFSTRAANEFIEAYKESHLEDSIEILDLWEKDLPEFGYEAAEGKYKIMRGKNHTKEEAKAWKKIVETTEHFKSADKYLLSTPMWNFSIPYRLKHYIDVIIQPGLTFSFTPEEGYKGLVHGKPVQIIAARGGAYGPGTGASNFDQQLPYVKSVFAFMGFTDIKVLTLEPTLMVGPEGAERALKKIIEEARETAVNF